MKELVKVPARYKPVLERVFTHYADAVRAIPHEGGGCVCLELELERGEKLAWHYVHEGERAICEGLPSGKEKTLLHVSIPAEGLRTVMEGRQSIRDAYFASGARVHGDIDFAFRVLAAAEKVRAREQGKAE